MNLVNGIKVGDRVTILVPNGLGRNGPEFKEKTGRAVMRGPAGWVLNMGGPHGTPGVATEENTVRVKRVEPRRVQIRGKVRDTGRDTGRYSGGYRVFRDGSYREDFGSDR